MTLPRTILTAIVAALPLMPLTAGAEQTFEAWLADLRAEARDMGVSEATIDAALRDVEPIESVIERDRNQPEFTLTFREYLDLVVPRERIEKGRQRMAEHEELLSEIASTYGVQPRIIVALWGVESDFGRVTGGFSVVDALVTLSFDSRRPQRFRPELLAALRIIDQGHVSASEMTGSWAGAMGQPQFMPTSFARFAVDHDGDGRRDIWSTHADVFASAANYLVESGWKAGAPWGHYVVLPPDMDTSMQANMRTQITERAQPMDFWTAKGVRSTDGSPLPSDLPDAALILPDGDGGPAILVHHNFAVLMRWNPSFFFASAVGRLADALAEPPVR